MCWVSLAIGIVIAFLVTFAVTTTYWSNRLVNEREQALKLIQRIQKNR